MRTFAPSHLDGLNPYAPGRSPEALARELRIGSLVKLDSNESALGASPRALSAAQAVFAGLHRYPDQEELRQAIAQWVGLSFEHVIVGNGSNELIDLVCQTFAMPGEVAAFPHPSFVCYRTSSIASAMRIVELPMREHLSYDLQAMLRGIPEDTKIFMIANPNNPTGCYLNASELRQLISAVPRDAIVMLDEAYAEFVDALDFASGQSWLGLHPGLIVLRTFSKAYGLAGLRVGYAVGNPELIAYLHRVRAPFNVNSMALAAARAALADQEHLQRHVDYIIRERARVQRTLDLLGCAVVPSQGNFLLVRVNGESGAELAKSMLRRGVIVRPMAPPLSEYVRISIGRVEESDRVIDALRDIVGASVRAPSSVTAHT